MMRSPAENRHTCPACAFTRPDAATDRCPQCGHRNASACPTCRMPIRAWTWEDCPGCGRPLDCEADNDQLPPWGALDERCGECVMDLRACRTLRCPRCKVMRLLRLSFGSDHFSRAEAALLDHGLLIARRAEPADTAPTPVGTLWIRSNCWPSAMWVLEAANLVDATMPPIARVGRCQACGYDLRGIGSTRCPECGEAVQRPWRFTG